jgi:hypothetical protein
VGVPLEGGEDVTTAPTIHRFPRTFATRARWKQQIAWLAGGAALAFAVPFVFADLVGVDRDAYYAIYIAAVVALFNRWADAAGGGLTAVLRRNWRWGVALGLAFAGTLLVLRAEEGTPHPGGLSFVGAIIWRGVAYGLADGLLLSAFPILVVFAAFAGHRLLRSKRAKIAVGGLALAASLAFTAVYHAGYPDFRGEKLRKPVAGDLVWSVPTLVTLNPLGAPIAHAGLHVAAVVHSYDTGTFLPPHPIRK